LTARNIGFALGPRLNAAGRLSTAYKAYDVLSADVFQEAYTIAQALDEENRERQKITKDIQIKVEERADGIENDWLLFDCDEEYSEGVVGLAASRLAESYYRPSIIGTITGDFIKASCRSIPSLNITGALDECAELMERYGGHAMAAGLTIKKENLEFFIDTLTRIISATLSEDDLIPKLNYDAEVSLEDLNAFFLNLINQLEPTGSENPSPLFVMRQARVVGLRRLGDLGEHLKFNATSANERAEKSFKVKPCPAIAFHLGSRFPQLHDSDLIDILFSFEENDYNGTKSLQMNIKDIHLLDTESFTN
jgi:single-stranded-DNA-specific exonuclease